MTKITMMHKKFSSACARFFNDDSGQALVEYILLLVVTVAILGLMKSSLKNVTVRFWTALAKRVAAPCPDCNAGSDFDL